MRFVAIAFLMRSDMSESSSVENGRIDVGGYVNLLPTLDS